MIYKSLLYFFAWKKAQSRKRLKALLTLLLVKRKIQTRTRNYLTSYCLVQPHQSEWQVLYKHGSDESLINAISLSRASFEHLLVAFSRYYITKSSVGKRGRLSKFMDKSTVLGLLLTFYTDCMGTKTLCRMFGAPPSTINRTLIKAEKALLRALKAEPLAAIKWPTLEQQREWALLVQRKNPLVRGRWGFIDGKNFHIQKPSSFDIQNACYNGWLHATLVTGCFCFGVDGCIVWGKHNIVGSWNDGDVSRDFQWKLCDPDLNLPQHGVLSDSAFPVSGDMFTRIYSPLKEGELDKYPIHLQANILKMSRAITSMRQSAEWGMGAVEKVYRRLLIRLPCNPVVRRIRLQVIHRLYNYRVRTTNISQIRSYFLNDN